ncbi:heme-binding protein [Methanogenium cariaci]|uniref:SOUL family heme-binding protein n=1 Tax=Methanogenium cariaci TaxID=2197 RepID=UPI0007866901|nr:heme-binding protein [Methanogenium cariaci]
MTDTISYEITAMSGELEFRSYPALVLATVDMTKDEAGFRLLFAYIMGYNRTGDTLPMTPPVITSRQVAMTRPAVSDVRSMSFVMPPGNERDGIPDPLDSRIRVTTQSGREVAVIRFSGYARPHEVAAAELQLREGLRKARIEPVEEPFLMRYHPPPGHPVSCDKTRWGGWRSND